MGLTYIGNASCVVFADYIDISAGDGFSLVLVDGDVCEAPVFYLNV